MKKRTGIKIFKSFYNQFLLNYFDKNGNFIKINDKKVKRRNLKYTISQLYKAHKIVDQPFDSKQLAEFQIKQKPTYWTI